MATTYRISLGPQSIAAIPKLARFIRVGVLLNQGGDPAAQAEVSNVRFWPRTPSDAMAPGTFGPGNLIAVATTGSTGVFRPGSQAGRLSGHWNPYQLSLDYAGAKELNTAFTGPIQQNWPDRVIALPALGPQP